MSKLTDSKLHIFRAGKHVTSAGDPMEFSAADVAQIAASYDPAVYRAPLVVGHPKTEDPAYGWADSLSASATDLFAAPADVDAEFAAMVNAKRFPNISVALWPPGHASNPKPQGYYLRHIGFLGAAAPSVKGLKPAQFSGSDEKIVTIEFSEGESETLLRKFVQLFTSEISRTTLQPATFAEPTKENTEMTPAELQAATAKLEKDKLEFAEQIATRAKADAAAALTAARASNVEFADGLATAGKILPTHKGAIVEALTALHGVAPVEFAEGDGKVTKSPADALRAVLSGSKAIVDFGRKTPEGQPGDGNVVAFAAPAGFSVDKERAALHARTLEFADKNKVSYEIALQAVMRANNAA